MSQSNLPDYDRSLLGKIDQKDQRAFEELYRSNYRRLLALAYKYVQSEPIAEEIVNDALLKIWTDGARLTINYGIAPYLSKSVVNRSINFINQQNRQMNKKNLYENDICLTEEDEDEALLLEQNLLKLESVLNELPPQCQKILIMSKFQKIKQQDIAKQLNLSIKTIKNQLTIGYEKIRFALSDQVTVYFVFLLIHGLKR